jgi:Skp family chaperone for outer membrane proteins
MTGRLPRTRLRIVLPVLVLILSLDISTLAQTAGSEMIAVVNLQHAIESTSDFQRAAEEWTVAMTSETADLSAKQKELRQAEEKLKAEQDGLNESTSTSLVRIVNELQREFDRMNADVQTELNDLRERLILPITEKVDQAIRGFAKENDLALILDISNPQVGIALSDDTLDITAAIVDYIERPLRSEDIP